MSTSSPNILYHVTFTAPSTPVERFLAVVRAVEDTTSFCSYHLTNDFRHIVPDYAAIRVALPACRRMAFDRIGSWWFPCSLHSKLSDILDPLNACRAELYGSRGRVLGTIYATPYLFGRDDIA